MHFSSELSQILRCASPVVDTDVKPEINEKFDVLIEVKVYMT